jgi:serine/threonine protein kinase
MPPLMKFLIVLVINSRVSSALKKVHEFGVHHHDLRPDNVLVRGDGSIYIVDFHLAVHHCDMGSECPDIPFLPGYI